MGILSWLGLAATSSYPNLEALMRELRRALPDDEPSVLRYIAIVSVLLERVVLADGRVSDREARALRELFSRIDRLSPRDAERVLQALAGKVPRISDDELELCFRELRALCDREERVSVLRLLVGVAESDGEAAPSELRELERVAEALHVTLDEARRPSA